MKSSGNGLPQTCMVTLFRLAQGEVRFDVLRGIDTKIYDKPETYVDPLLRAEAYWLVSQYEPRITFNGMDMAGMPEPGNFAVTASGDIES